MISPPRYNGNPFSREENLTLLKELRDRLEAEREEERRRLEAQKVLEMDRLQAELDRELQAERRKLQEETEEKRAAMEKVLLTSSASLCVLRTTSGAEGSDVVVGERCLEEVGPTGRYD